MKRLLFGLGSIVSLLLTAAPAAGMERTLTVDPTLRDPVAPRYNRLSAAVRDANDIPAPVAVRIVVRPGTSVETAGITVERSMTIEGTSSARVVVEQADSMVVHAGCFTLRDLTLRGPDPVPPHDETTNLRLQPATRAGTWPVGQVLVERCRFLEANIGVRIAASPSIMSRDVELRNNNFRNSRTGIQLDTAAPFGRAPGLIDFTSRRNRIVIRNAFADENPIPFDVRRLAPASRLRSLDDVIDAESTHTIGHGDVNGFVFMFQQPRWSVISGADIRLAHRQRSSEPGLAQSFAGVKIHGQDPGTEPPEGERYVVDCRGVRVHIEDRSIGAALSSGNAFQVAGARVDLLVSGGEVTWDIAEPRNLLKVTFSVVGGAVDPRFRSPYRHGVFHEKIPVEQVIVGAGGGPGTVTPLE